MSSTIIWIIPIVIIMLIVIIALFFIIKRNNEFINNYKQITYGMEKQEVISILGQKFTQSLLENNITQLEWQISDMSHTGKMKKVAVKFKDNKVIEVNASNME